MGDTRRARNELLPKVVVVRLTDLELEQLERLQELAGYKTPGAALRGVWRAELERAARSMAR